MKMKTILLMASTLFASTAFLFWFGRDAGKHKTSKLSTSRCEKVINSLYEDVYGTIPEAERQKITEQGGNPVYGEILYKSVETVLKELNLGKNDVIYDLGSGLGKMIIQSYLTTPVKKAVGIELSKTRLSRARKALSNLKKMNLEEDTRTIDFKYGNIALEQIPDATAVFMCSTCYSDELMQQITENLSQNKKGLKLATLKSLPQNPYFQFVKKVKLPMTWSRETGSAVNFYILSSPR